MNSLSEPYKALNVVEFGSDITCDAYELPNGEIRYGQAGVSLLLGYERTWYNKLPKRPGNPLNALRSKGFTGCLVAVKVSREGKRGASMAQTISGTDLDVLVIHEALRGNKRAIALLKAPFTEVRVSRERAEERTSPANSQGKNGSF